MNIQKNGTPATPSLPPMQPLKPPHSMLMIVVGVGFAILMALMFSVEVEAVVTGEGAVETESGLQTIESQEGGIVATVAVSQGERVEAGQEIATLSNVSILAERLDIQNELDLLGLKEFRLLQERTGTTAFRWPDVFSDLTESILQDQYDLFLTRRQRQTSESQAITYEIEALKRDLSGAENELEAMQAEYQTVKNILDFQMEGHSKGFVSKADALRTQSQYAQMARELVKTRTRIPTLQAQISEAGQRLEKTLSEQQQQSLDELESVTLRIRSLEALVQAASDKDQRRILRAARAGIINAVHVSGPGDVVQPGEPIVDIVPVDQMQIVHARIDPSLRRGLYVGLPAKVSFTALQDLRAAPVDAEVVFVAADTQKDQQGRTWYEVHVRTHDDAVALPRGGEAAIEPGMQATVSIVVGSHTLVDFLLRPLSWAMQNAFRER